MVYISKMLLPFFALSISPTLSRSVRISILCVLLLNILQQYSQKPTTNNKYVFHMQITCLQNYNFELNGGVGVGNDVAALPTAKRAYNTVKLWRWFYFPFATDSYHKSQLNELPLFFILFCTRIHNTFS